MAKKPTKRAKPTQTEQQRTEALRLIRDKLDSQTMDERHVVEVFETPCASDKGQWVPVGSSRGPEPTTFSELWKNICQWREAWAVLDQTGEMQVPPEVYARFRGQYLALGGKLFRETENASRNLERLERACRQPVSPRARRIFEKLRSLPETDAMDTAALLNWLGRTQPIDNIDDGTLRRALRELEPYGLQNRKKIGYYIH